MNILVLGATGMLGYSLFSNLSEYSELNVYGTVRNISGLENFFSNTKDKLIFNIDITDIDSVECAFNRVKPDIVLNCIGLIKQLDAAKQHISAIKINTLLPHQLASLCERFDSKLIHFSTDCVFDGNKGNYTESDLPTATDLYGRSKFLGEVTYGKHLTLRTSIIGHELVTSRSLIDWFLAQESEVSGFTKAVFSGLPTCYIAKLLAERVLPNSDLRGLYHLSVEPIDKFSLLSLVANVYGKNINIHETTDVVIDRSLNSTCFKSATNFTSPSWQELVEYMHTDYLKRYHV